MAAAVFVWELANVHGAMVVLQVEEVAGKRGQFAFGCTSWAWFAVTIVATTPGW